MKHLFLASIFLSASFVAAHAQTAPVPAAPAKAATSGKAAGSAAAAPGAYKLPPGIPRGRGIMKTAFALRYQDLKIGTGALAEPNKLYKVLYTGWLAADGHKFDSSEDHRQPLRDKDGKPVLGDDGKPKLGDVQPISFMQGFGRVIPGFDQGFDGMKAGGKRRLFIPWQLAYGARGRPGPDPMHPGIPPKADLIFDIELVDVADVQVPNRPVANPVHPGASLPHMQIPPTGAKPAAPPAEKPAEAPASPSTAPATAAPASPSATPSAPATAAPPTTPPAETKPETPPTTPPQPQTQPQ